MSRYCLLHMIPRSNTTLTVALYFISPPQWFMSHCLCPCQNKTSLFPHLEADSGVEDFAFLIFLYSLGVIFDGKTFFHITSYCFLQQTPAILAFVCHSHSSCMYSLATPDWLSCYPGIHQFLLLAGKPSFHRLLAVPPAEWPSAYALLLCSPSETAENDAFLHFHSQAALWGQPRRSSSHVEQASNIWAEGILFTPGVNMLLRGWHHIWTVGGVPCYTGKTF